MLPVVVLYAHQNASEPSGIDGFETRWAGPTRQDEMTRWDLCEGSTRRAQGTTPLSVIPV